MSTTAAHTFDDLEGGVLRKLSRLFFRDTKPTATTAKPRPGKRKSTTQPTQPAAPNDKAFRVFVLGTSGAGKTVLLSSMYHHLSVEHPEVGFYLDVSDKQRKILTRKYQELADPTKDWPSSTLRSETSEWVFTCAQTGRAGCVKVFDFTYFDYPGETITELSENLDFEPGKEAMRADAVLVLLDGRKVLQMMQDDADGYFDSLYRDLDFLLPIVQKLTSKPVHFVVSKWDLIDGTYSLRDVRRKLMHHERFRVIVNQRREWAIPIRLIPMSAIGMDFAELGDDNVMMKRPDARAPRPYQVEMSIACTLLDGFQIAAKRLSEKEVQILISPRRFLGVPIGAGRLAIWSLQIAAGAISAHTPYDLGASAFSALLKGLDKKLAEGGEEVKQEIETALSQVRTEKDGVGAIMLKNLLLLKQLDAKHPSSNLLSE